MESQAPYIIRVSSELIPPQVKTPCWVPIGALRARGVSEEAIVLYLTLVSYFCDFQTGVSWVSNERLARELHISLSSIKRRLQELRQAGILRVWHRKDRRFIQAAKCKSYAPSESKPQRREARTSELVPLSDVLGEVMSEIERKRRLVVIDGERE